MRKLIVFLMTLLIFANPSFASKLPSEVITYLESSIPGTFIRFDGVVILPNGTLYLPLFPSLFSDITELNIKATYPENKNINDLPDAIVFNNDFVLLKVINDSTGNKTIINTTTPALEIRTGLLPQDMLVPSGLIIPENLKGIKGNLKIDTKNEDSIKCTSKESFEEFLSENDLNIKHNIIPQLKDKVLYISTNYSKNIQVVNPAGTLPEYSLAQKSIPIDIEPTADGRFILVTSYERPFLDIISVADSRFIRQINLSTFPDEIVIDNTNQKAYITAPKSSLIFVVDLKTMSLIQKIRINGYCEKLLVTEDIIFYSDKLKNDIWAIETNNNYAMRNVGRFPNVSSLAYSDSQLYIASRTKSRVAVIDYSDLSLIKEFTTPNKPIQMKIINDTLYILCAQNNIIERINIKTGKRLENIDLNTEGFSTVFNMIENSSLAVLADIKKNIYTIFDLETEKIIKQFKLNIPIKDIKITKKIKLFE